MGELKGNLLKFQNKGAEPVQVPRGSPQGPQVVPKCPQQVAQVGNGVKERKRTRPTVKKRSRPHRKKRKRGKPMRRRKSGADLESQLYYGGSHGCRDGCVVTMAVITTALLLGGIAFAAMWYTGNLGFFKVGG